MQPNVLSAPLRRLIEWTADYYLSPIAAVLRMALASYSALDGARTVTEYRATGRVPERMTPQRVAVVAPVLEPLASVHRALHPKADLAVIERHVEACTSL